ncbi:arginine--tRNA ligase [Candidatus Pacearchaeota archaeon]|nr:arginine--tRNA ligase [Candidatus Pacearchaeota archaeon]
MKEQLSKQLSKHLPLNKQQIENLLEAPPSSELGDYAFPCFSLSRELKKSPVEIAQELAKKIQTDKFFEKVEQKGPYINIFLNRTEIVKQTLKKIQFQKEKYGFSNDGKNKKIVIDMSSPNIAKPFGIGHLRSTIIGNSIANICKFQGYKPIKINYLGDWGTPFGKIIAGYLEFGNPKKLSAEPIKHLYEIYVKTSKNEKFEELGREWFKKLELGDKEAVALWKKFKDFSIKDFNKIYSLLNVQFDAVLGESYYNDKMEKTIRELKSKNLLEESQGAFVVNLEKYNLGVALIKKSDGATLYATRDITAAIDRYKKYKFEKMFYEVGAEQKYHFKQLFKILELLGYKWAKNCVHIDHGLYLDKDGKKFATRKGKTIFMEDILEETKELAKQEIEKREKVSKIELEKRSLVVARAAIIYGDLKNYRSNDSVFDIQHFLSFEGNTGPYLLYSYARARSILRKSKSSRKNYQIDKIEDLEKNLIMQLAQFPEIVSQAYKNLSPNLIANYSFQLAQSFNEFYHAFPVLNSEQESFRLELVSSFSQVLKNALNLLGIQTIENM